MRLFVMSIFPLLWGCASVHTEILVEAPPENVWAVITDTESYPEWNPVMTKVNKRHAEGETLTYQVKAPGEEPAEIEAEVRKIIPNSFVRQTGGVWGILTFDHTYTLEKVDSGTKVTQHEDYSGVGLLFWDHKKMERAYEESNEALKRRVLSRL